MSARLVFGAASIGNLREAMSDELADELLEVAWGAGIRRFDTAPHYGLGLSEQRLGRFLGRKPVGSYRISTKVGRLLVPNPGATGRDPGGFDVPADKIRIWDPSPAGIDRSINESLERMRIHRIDTVYLHDPDDYDLAQALELAPQALDAVRERGLVASVGVATNSSDAALAFAERMHLEEIMIAGEATLLEHRAWEALIPTSAARSTRVVSAAIFNSGILAGGSAARFNYATADEVVLQRLRRIEAICGHWGVELRTAALHAPLQDPRIDSIAIGARTPEQMRDTVRRLGTHPPLDLWRDLAAEGLVPPPLNHI